MPPSTPSISGQLEAGAGTGALGVAAAVESGAGTVASGASRMESAWGWALAACSLPKASNKSSAACPTRLLKRLRVVKHLG
ncbi:hypothetical protein GCM10027511_02430 [Hymenobacter humi]